MELGPNDDALSDDFNSFCSKVEWLHSQITSRKIMTSSEKRKLEIMLNQIRLFEDVNLQQRDVLKEKILYLLKTYYSMFNG